MAFLRLLMLLPAMLLGLVTSQAPEFAQQYRQRLGGAVDELTRVVDRFMVDARRQHLDPQAAIDRLLANADRLARDRGEAIRDDIDRRDRLARQLEAFRTSGAFGRLAAFATNFDPGLVAGTWEAFEPAVPITLEGLAGATLGFLAGLLLTEAARRWMRRVRAERAAREAVARS